MPEQNDRGASPTSPGRRVPPVRGRSLRALAAIGIGLAACLFSCRLGDGGLGEAPIGPGAEMSGVGGVDTSANWLRDSVAGNMRIFASPHTLKAGNKGRSLITVQVFDANHNPLPGRRVRFAASLGTITAADTTGADGTATAAYAGLPRNGEVRILAFADVADTQAVVGTSVQLEGLTLAIAPLSPDTLIDESVPLTVTVIDGEGEPVAAAPIRLQGAAQAEGLTDGAGRFRTSVLSAEEKQVKVSATALGAAASVTVGFWKTRPVSRSRTLLLFAEPARIAAANGESSAIKAILYDESHNPVAGKRIDFSASQGIITPSDTTGEDGAAEARFQGFARNADAVITASYRQGDSTRLASTTVTMAGLQFEVRPAAGEALLADTVPVSIRLRDALGRPLPDVQVVLKGALQSSVRTNASGSAAATVAGGSEKTVSVEGSALGAVDSGKVVFLSALPVSSSSSKAAVGNLRIFVDKSTIRASNTDQTTVRVIAFDKFNNPLSGRQVRFTASQGIIAAADTTDAKGEAAAVYRAVPLNTDARITASLNSEDSSLSVFTTVTLADLRVEVHPSVTDALLNRTVPVDIRIIDGAGNPVPDAAVIFNGAPGQGATDGNGVFRTAVTSGTQKRVTISASARGAKDSGYVDFWNVLPGKGDNTVNSIRKMRIFTSRSQLRADNSDFAVISVILTNENNNPATGEAVRFTSDLGLIGQTALVDSNGRATAILRSAPVNGTCTVTATAVGRNLSAATEILFSGVTLQLSANRVELKVGETAELEAFLKDASGNPIGGDAVTFALGGQGVFDNGNASYTATLNPNGKAMVRVGAASAGKVAVRAAALNTADSLSLSFSNNTLTLAASRTSLAVGGGDSTLITATLVDGAGAPVSGATIAFASNAGAITKAAAVTDGSGRASTYLRSAVFAGTATVQANAPSGTSRITVDFAAAAASSIKLTITADNIGVNGGVADLRAVVSDAGGNLVSGETVNFRILRGPGGGESITQPVVRTQAGVAVSRLQAGGIASGYRGTLVEARVGDLADTSKLTLSGPAHVVSVSRPEDDTITVAQGGSINQSVFEYNVGAVVQDINGNLVADGTEVHFSAVVTGMSLKMRALDHWEGLTFDSGGVVLGGESIQAVYKEKWFDILPFEDINDNIKYDPGIDADLDGDNTVLRRGEDRDGDGVFSYDPKVHVRWFDINGNGKCDADSGEGDTVVTRGGKVLWSDIYPDGKRQRSEVLSSPDTSFHGCRLPVDARGFVTDYPYAEWESRDYLPKMTFRNNDFAVAIEVSAVTRNGVAQARLRYPRQFATRLMVTVNAEVNGIRDRDGERFRLPQIK